MKSLMAACWDANPSSRPCLAFSFSPFLFLTLVQSFPSTHSKAFDVIVDTLNVLKLFILLMCSLLNHNQMMCGCGSAACTQSAKGEGVGSVVEWAEGRGVEFESEEG